MPKVIPVAGPLMKMSNPNVVQDSFYDEVVEQLVDLSDEVTQTLQTAITQWTGGADPETVRALIERTIALLEANT